MKALDRSDIAVDRQYILPLFPLRNSEFLSNHWLEYRLPLEPEWQEVRTAAQNALEQLLALWRIEKDRVARYGDEAGLEEKFIQPVFEILGWRLKYQAHLHGREPDYALFLDDEALDAALRAGRTNPDFWSPAALVADAKAWHISLDRPTREGARREYPPEQIEWYLNHSLRDYVILTNGRLWRLVPRLLGPAKPRFQTYLEIDLPGLLDSLTRGSHELQLGPGSTELETFLRFFLFFSPMGFTTAHGRKPLVTRAVEGSSEYSLGVGEELKERVFEALRLCIEGFIAHRPNGLDGAGDLRACQEHSFTFLYRLLFIMYAEDRGLLPYRRNDTYTRNRSFARHRDDVAVKLDNLRRGLDRRDYSREETTFWEDLKTLFDLIDHGHGRYGVPAYNGGLFDLEANTFLSEKALPDWCVAQVIDQLGRAPRPGQPELGLFRVDYRDLAIQQLGSVYEGLLELRPRYAEEAMRVVRSTRAGSRMERVIRAADQVPEDFEATGITYPAESIYLATDKGERRQSGSYYTPDQIVDHIVEKALSGRCREISEDLRQEIDATSAALEGASGEEREQLEKRLRELEGAFDNRVLNLKVLDPAMGSGHFLIRACQYLAEEIATNPFTKDPGADQLNGDEATITYWKRQVAESCLYGVDVNRMAVELAKLALWLETVAADAPLTFLDHHFRSGDSIIGARIGHLGSLPGDEGLLQGQLENEIQKALPALLEPLAAIRAIPSDTAEHVKQKERVFRRRFVPALRRFTAIADLWCAHALEGGGPVTREHYAEAVKNLGARRQFETLLRSDWAQAAMVALREQGVRCFHWELAFPEVFFEEGGTSRGGFDVVIGNPPYDVLSEREIGHDISRLRNYIAQDDTLRVSRVGKNNLYKLFICRAVELLKDGGYLGFIVPMPLLGDEQARGVRQLLLSAGEFCEIHAFPQKDNPARRVFQDAKLSTTVVAYRKLNAERRSDGRFRSQVHPAQFIEPESPGLTLNSNSITLYDPSNLTIVSCSQEDWDLAARIIERPGIGRLGSYCKSFQGEVNETNEARRPGVLHDSPGPERQLVRRGSNVCLYVLREASQGEAIYIDSGAFLAGKSPDSKAFHSRVARIGFQRSSPQNNYRRIIAAYVPADEFCFDTISYIPEINTTRFSLDFLLGLLNSKLLEWYFRLGSTNSKVN